MGVFLMRFATRPLQRWFASTQRCDVQRFARFLALAAVVADGAAAREGVPSVKLCSRHCNKTFIQKG